jgi:hypothetical protein
MIRHAQARAARKRYQQIAPVLNEQSRRRFVALEARLGAWRRQFHGAHYWLGEVDDLSGIFRYLR